MALGQVQTHGIYVASLDVGEPVRILAADTEAAFATPGYLLRVLQGVLTAQRLDTDRERLVGDPFALAQAVGTDDGLARSALSVSGNVLAYRPGVVTRREIVRIDRTGNVIEKVGNRDERSPANPALAHDGRRVAFNRTEQGNSDVWLLDARGVATRFTFDEANDLRPIWSPDGTQIVFSSVRMGPGDLFLKPASGASPDQPILVDPLSKVPLDWSADGRFILYAAQDPKNGSDLWALPVNGDRKPVPIVQSTFDDIEGQFSPDGRWVAYASNESGRYETYVRPFPGPGGRWQVSTEGVHSHGGLRTEGTSSMSRATADSCPRCLLLARTLVRWRSTLLRRCFRRASPSAATSRWAAATRGHYVVARDGRFLMITPVDDAVATPITIMLNWTAALAKK